MEDSILAREGGFWSCTNGIGGTQSSKPKSFSSKSTGGGVDSCRDGVQDDLRGYYFGVM